MAEHQHRLKTDSPLSRRIVRAFFDFLNSVEPAPGVDTEGLEVARECLAEVFRLDSSSTADPIKPNLVDIFSSLEANSDTCTAPNSVDQYSSSASIAAKALINNASSSLGDDWTREPNALGLSKDELFGKFFAALEDAHFFKSTPDGKDDTVQLDKATTIFHEALAEMEGLGCQALDQNTLAETLKSQGNKAMQSKQFIDALELYSCAIALCGNNAVYYCNRAAAYTQINKYTEAINDCMKSIGIDPSYSKAYSRLGLAYYAQGNYSDALEKGFKKALQLDPNNESIKENIRVAEQRVKEQHQRAERSQSTNSGSHDGQGNSHSAGGSRSHPTPPPFSSTPFNTAGLPADIANMIFNMTSNAHGGQHSDSGQGETFNFSYTDSDEPGIRIGGGTASFDFGEQMPGELTGALRSVMEMMTGGATQGNQQDGTNGRPPSNGH